MLMRLHVPPASHRRREEDGRAQVTGIVDAAGGTLPSTIVDELGVWTIHARAASRRRGAMSLTGHRDRACMVFRSRCPPVGFRRAAGAARTRWSCWRTSATAQARSATTWLSARALWRTRAAASSSTLAVVAINGDRASVTNRLARRGGAACAQGFD
jgi:hypothetical protein